MYGIQLEADFFYMYKPLQVTVIGAGSDVGYITSLFLKQQKIIKILALYDEPNRRVLGVANDLAHIDTSPEVEGYQGRMYLKDALYVRFCFFSCGFLGFCSRFV